MSQTMQSIGNAVRSSRADKWMAFALVVFLLVIYIWFLRSDQIYSLLLVALGLLGGLWKGNTEK